MAEGIVVQFKGLKQFIFVWLTLFHFIMLGNVEYFYCTYNVSSDISHQHQYMSHQVCMSSL